MPPAIRVRAVAELRFLILFDFPRARWLSSENGTVVVVVVVVVGVVVVLEDDAAIKFR